MIEQYDKMIAFHLFGVPVNWTIASTWIVMALLVFVSFLATRGLKTGMKVSRWQTGMEVIVGAVRSQIREMANDEPMKYLPLIGTFFLFIATCVLLSIIPWFKIPTASLSTTGAFAAVVLAGIPYYGIRNAGISGYLKKYTEPSIILMPINVISDITSTAAMARRSDRVDFADAGAVCAAVADADVGVIHGIYSIIHFCRFGGGVYVFGIADGR